MRARSVVTSALLPQLDRRATIGSLEQPGQQVWKPQESLVLELYGITRPCESLTCFIETPALIPYVYGLSLHPIKIARVGNAAFRS